MGVVNELLQLAIDHHLYILVPLGVGVWVWSNWERWTRRWQRWQLQRAMPRKRAYAGPRASAAAGRAGQAPRLDPNDMRGQLREIEAQRRQVAREISALGAETTDGGQATARRRAQRPHRRRGR